MKSCYLLRRRVGADVKILECKEPVGKKEANTKTLSIDVPDVAFSTLRMDMQEMAFELRRAAIVKWYEIGMLSQGRSAEILGITRAAFIDLLTKYRVSPFQYTDQELFCK